MQVGLIGLGRMGGAMAARLREAGHDVVGYDHVDGERNVASIVELVARLATPRVIWLMVPAGVVESVLDEVTPQLASGDLIVDGGNSHFGQAQSRADRLGAQGIGFVDVGVSGGVWGETAGYGLMVGGDSAWVDRLRPALEALKPAGTTGLVHAGPVGAGHFAKMVHNGIEYGLMQAYAEGFELLLASPLVPDAAAVVDSWRSGTVIRSWLLDLLAQALADDPHLASVAGQVDDTGEGRWCVDEAVRLAVPAHVIAAALFARFASRQDDSPAMKVVAALRHQFGRHAVTAS